MSCWSSEIPRLRRNGAMTIFWDVDAPATLDRLARNPAIGFHSDVSKYDLVLTYGGGDPVVGHIDARGPGVHSDLQCAGSSSLTIRSSPIPMLRGRLSFLGNRCRTARLASRNSS